MPFIKINSKAAWKKVAAAAVPDIMIIFQKGIPNTKGKDIYKKSSQINSHYPLPQEAGMDSYPLHQTSGPKIQWIQLFQVLVFFFLRRYQFIHPITKMSKDLCLYKGIESKQLQLIAKNLAINLRKSHQLNSLRVGALPASYIL